MLGTLVPRDPTIGVSASNPMVDISQQLPAKLWSQNIATHPPVYTAPKSVTPAPIVVAPKVVASTPVPIVSSPVVPVATVIPASAMPSPAQVASIQAQVASTQTQYAQALQSIAQQQSPPPTQAVVQGSTGSTVVTQQGATPVASTQSTNVTNPPSVSKPSGISSPNVLCSASDPSCAIAAAEAQPPTRNVLSNLAAGFSIPDFPALDFFGVPWYVWGLGAVALVMVNSGGSSGRVYRGRY